jgi:uncharacterized protein YqgC (DUF456 family)
MDTTGLVLVGIAILVGLAGVVVPVLPGLPLVWGAVLVWALIERTTVAWIVLAAATLLVAVSQVVKYLVPGRRMRSAGVPMASLGVGAALAVVGFFVVPIVGGLGGFVLGVYLAERLRLEDHQRAWAATVQALKAVGLAILIELGAGLLIAGAWLATVLAT